MATVTIEVAKAHLDELIDHLQLGETLVITRDERPVARLQAENSARRKIRRPGNCKGMMRIVADDEEHLEAFLDYME